MLSASLSPSHYVIPNQEGYFPAGSDGRSLVLIANATLYEIHPSRYEKPDEPLASGLFTLHDPAAGTADEVALVGQCGDTLFYIMNDDATTKTSEFEFMIMLPENCIILDLTGCSDADALRVESLFAARTKFHDESKSLTEITEYPANLPDDKCSRALFRASRKIANCTKAVAAMGASRIDSYGEMKRDSVVQSTDVKVGKTTILIAKGTRAISKKTLQLTEKVSDKISDVLGGKVGRATEIKEGDSANKRRARSLLLASTIAYAEVGNGAAEAYELMVTSAKSQATSFVDKKYGKDMAELTRHTAGAVANFGRAALTARRVVDVKKVVKSAAKRRVKEAIKASV
jgi:hypothetical protein